MATATTAQEAPYGVLAGLRELSEAAVLELASDSARARRLAEVDELVVAARWAALVGEPRDERDPMTRPGGDGTPPVREYAVPELAMARGTHALTARALVGDALDLAHRLPLVWAQVRTGECEPWVARRVAVQSRSLDRVQVLVVDRAVARAVTGHAPSTVLQIAAAKVIEADPEAHAMQREVERHKRYVHLSRADEFGYRHVIARVTAGDAAWVDAMVDRVADILALTHGADHNHDELRALAFGWLARPVDLLRLLLEHTDADQTSDEPDPEPGDDGRPAWASSHLDETVGRLAELSTRQLAALRGRGVVYVHLTDTALRLGSGVARVEGLGPLPVRELGELLGHADVRVTPVLDLAGRRRADAYEHDEGLKDLAWLLSGGDVFPFSPRTATRGAVDFDHSIPYEPHGPPGQTGPHNCGPLRRRHHRWKTFGGFRCRTAGPGRHLWQTPHGLCFLVDQHGTRRLPEPEAELMLSAPPGLDIYLSPVQIDLDDAAFG